MGMCKSEDNTLNFLVCIFRKKKRVNMLLDVCGKVDKTRRHILGSEIKQFIG